MPSKQMPTHTHRGSRGLITQNTSQHLHGNKVDANIMSLLERGDLRRICLGENLACLCMQQPYTRLPSLTTEEAFL